MSSPAPTPPHPILPVHDGEAFEVGRIFCIGRNYAAHAAEMGMPAEPLFFMKPPSALAAPTSVPYPANTKRLDHEIELVLALGAGGRPQTDDEARALIYAYAVGVDLTRRDVQGRLKNAGSPWEEAKGFDGSAPVGPLQRAEDVGHPRAGRIWLSVDGETRQDGRIEDMILSPEALIVALARTWKLAPGDLIFTGTPEGVGPLASGARVEGGVEGVGEITFEVA